MSPRAALPLLLGCLHALPALGADVAPLYCSQPHEVDRFQLLRRLSLDLRGQVPSYEEYLALEGKTEIPASVVSSYLASDGFRHAMRRYHESFLWPNVSNVGFAVNTATVAPLELKAGGSSVHLFSAPGRRSTYRGLADVVTTANGLQCGDFEQLTFDPAHPGRFRVDPNGPSVRRSTVNGRTVYQEGWRWVHPYWESDPSVRIKVCAFDAQETLTTTVGTATVSCGHYTATGKRECGCGPNLKFCYGPNQKVASLVTAAMREQVARAVDKVSVGGRPYTDLVLSTKAELNGPLAAWKRDVASNLSLARVFTVPDKGEPLLALDFTDVDTWTEVDRGGQHAGVLTMPAFLLRFQTDRSRANQFRIGFECEAFEPPSQLEAPGSGTPACRDDGTDLTKRCTCRYCHKQLEPLAAAFGPFAEAGTTFLDATAFPRMSQACVGSTTAFCRRFYVTDADADNPGALLPWQYADASHPAIQAALAAGPRARAKASVDSGQLSKCAVKRMFRFLVKRDMHVQGSNTDELQLLGELSTGFSSNGYSLPWLVERVVSLPQYRRVR